MSVLIKGMKMPQECLSCDFCNPFTDEPYCRRLMRRTPKVARIKDCPLVPVPAADVQEVRRGRWIFNIDDEGWSWDKPYMCDQCGEWVEKVFQFCPSCGAKMEGEGE